MVGEPNRGHAGEVPAPLAVVAAALESERTTARARLARTDEDLAALFAASRDSNADDEHDPEGQTIAYERAQLTASADAARDHLREVDAAAARLAAGTYGVCEVCSRPIGVARLEARPTARTCVEHAPPARRAR
ncbi:MAG: TraR/DksA family transcriptional regulator [Ornithinibacter sp.]